MKKDDVYARLLVNPKKVGPFSFFATPFSNYLLFYNQMENIWQTPPFSPTIFVLTIVIYLFQTTQDVSMVLYPLTGDTQRTKCHPLLWLNMVTLGIQKSVMYMCMFTSPFLVPTKHFVLLNSSSIRVEYNQILHLSLW